MAAGFAYPIRTPQWVLTYEGVNISVDISRMALDIVYTDRVGGAASELEIALEDHDKLWQGPWLPQQGDLANLQIGYRGEPLLPCGDFEVDQTELDGPPDVFRIRCLSAYITPAMRTRRSVAYEGRTPAQIAGAIAAVYGLELLTAEAKTEVAYARITQREETDLEFLRRLAEEHDYEFSIRGRQLVFYPRLSLERVQPVIGLSRENVLGFAFVSKTHRTYKAAQFAYQEPSAKRLLLATVSREEVSAVSDTLKVQARCENAAQAAIRADAALQRANMFAMTAALKLEGSTDLSAGNSVTLSGFGAHDGIYMLQSARHRLARDSGYTTEIEARKIGQ
ncbi:MAG TPA: hypothetical protein VJ718_11385 [Candidatus Binataceae bacterium]|nr:hypothetical protein [Candidatus Binataceae bacterium]